VAQPKPPATSGAEASSPPARSRHPPPPPAISPTLTSRGGHYVPAAVGGGAPGGVAGGPPTTLQPGGVRDSTELLVHHPHHPAALRGRRAQRGRWSRQTPPHPAAARPASSGPRSTADHAAWRPLRATRRRWMARWVAVVRRLRCATAPCTGRTCAPHQRAVSHRADRRGLERWEGGRHHPVRMGGGPRGWGSILRAGGGAPARTVIHTSPQLVVTPPPLSLTTSRPEPPRSPAADPLRRRAVLWIFFVCASPLWTAARKGPATSRSRLARSHG